MDPFEVNYDDGDIIEKIQEEEAEKVPGPFHENTEKDDSSDDTKRIVKPKKVIVRPQIKLDATRLLGPRGIGIIESTFKEVQFKGKGHEKEDVDQVLRVMEHWAHRLFPKMTFHDCLDKIEDLGSKRNVSVAVTKIRLGMDEPEPQVITMEEPEVLEHDSVDPFDQLISAQPKQPTLTEEQRARMLRNRLLAEEIRMKKIKEVMDRKKVTDAISVDPVPNADLTSERQSASVTECMLIDSQSISLPHIDCIDLNPMSQSSVFSTEMMSTCQSVGSNIDQMSTTDSFTLLTDQMSVSETVVDSEKMSF